MKKLLLTLVALVAAMSMSAQVLTVKKGGSVVATYTDIHADEFVYGDAVQTPEAVNLGLSVKWATFNVGATRPEENGPYFQWGDTKGFGKNINDGCPFDWTCYKWCNGAIDTITKYSTYGGFVDNKTQLELAVDAAAVNLGGNWRMPTMSEFQELISNCYCEWTANYTGTNVAGTKVYKVKNDSDKGKYNNVSGYTTADTHIFLPACGSRSDGGCWGYGTRLSYWTSNLLNPGHNGANIVRYDYEGSVDAMKVVGVMRYVGAPVRAVCP